MIMISSVKQQNYVTILRQPAREEERVPDGAHEVDEIQQTRDPVPLAERLLQRADSRFVPLRPGDILQRITLKHDLGCPGLCDRDIGQGRTRCNRQQLDLVHRRRPPTQRIEGADEQQRHGARHGKVLWK